MTRSANMKEDKSLTLTLVVVLETKDWKNPEHVRAVGKRVSRLCPKGSHGFGTQHVWVCCVLERTVVVALKGNQQENAFVRVAPIFTSTHVNVQKLQLFLKAPTVLSVQEDMGEWGPFSWFCG